MTDTKVVKDDLADSEIESEDNWDENDEEAFRKRTKSSGGNKSRRGSTTEVGQCYCRI